MSTTTVPVELQGVGGLKRRLKTLSHELGSPIAEAVSPMLGAGKLLRPRLVYAVGGTNDATDRAAEAVELIHVASLVHDDLLDGATERRGEPTVIARGGVTLATAAGDALFAQAFRQMTRTTNAQAVQLLATTVRELVQGEWGQTHARGRLDVSAEEYLAYAGGKTGALLGGALAVGACLAGDDRLARWMQAGVAIGTAFQIDDDLLDLEGDPAMTGKPRGRDVANGVMSLPLIYALEEDPYLYPMLQRAPVDPEEVERVCARVIDSPALARTRRKSRELLAHGAAAIDALADDLQRAELRAVMASLEGRRA